jgi:hypothetical protein
MQVFVLRQNFEAFEFHQRQIAQCDPADCLVPKLNPRPIARRRACPAVRLRWKPTLCQLNRIAPADIITAARTLLE